MSGCSLGVAGGVNQKGARHMDQRQPNRLSAVVCLVIAVVVFASFYIYLLTHPHPNVFIVGIVMMPPFLITLILSIFGVKYMPRYKVAVIHDMGAAVVVLAFLMLFGALPIYLMTLGWSQVSAYLFAFFIWLGVGLIPLSIYGYPPGGFTERSKEDQERYTEWWNRKFGGGESDK
jgi:hypothetical protein